MSSVKNYILLADEETSTKEKLSSRIAAGGFDINIVSMNDGLQLRRFLEAVLPGELLPAFILISRSLPAFDAFECLDYLKNHPLYQNIPILVIFSDNDPDLMELARRHGAHDVLTISRDEQTLQEAGDKIAELSNRFHCTVKRL